MSNPIPVADDVCYGGHQSDIATELTYMQARYYNPIVGWFMAVDPVGFGRYTYPNNNPYQYVDLYGKVGMLASAAVDAIVGFTVDGLVQTYGVIVKNGSYAGDALLRSAIVGGMIGLKPVEYLLQELARRLSQTRLTPPSHILFNNQWTRRNRI